MDTSRLLASYNYHTPTQKLPVAVDRQTDRQTDRTFILINHSSFAIKMSQPNINTPNSDLVSSLSQSQSYLSPNFLVIIPGLTSSVRLCGVERCPAQQSEEEEEEGQHFYHHGDTICHPKSGYVTTKLHGTSTCRRNNKAIFSDRAIFDVSYRRRIPATLIINLAAAKHCRWVQK